MHWGYEYDQRADPGQTAAANALLAAGANLVVGHHPHVVQALSLDLRGFSSNQRLPTSQVFVAYSLGNFVFDQEREGTNQGLALRAFFDADGLRAVQALPVWAGPRPRLMTPDEAAPLLARIQPPPPRVGFACAEDTCQPIAAPETAESGIFWSGAIDLTGDGENEIVRRAGERVTIYQDLAEEQRSGGAEENITPAPQSTCSPILAEVYTTPAEWRVVDAALGDPNDDGRYELLLAIWQTDAAGHDRSQPYIVGYRGGEYKLMWGGRPLARPISEVALGDVDGDGRQELVTVEEDRRWPCGAGRAGILACCGAAPTAVTGIWCWWRGTAVPCLVLRLESDPYMLCRVLPVLQNSRSQQWRSAGLPHTAMQGGVARVCWR